MQTIAGNVIDIETTRSPEAAKDRYARRIRERLVQSVEAVLDVGRMVLEAKAELPHGEFEAMVRDDLGWSPQTARRFMTIGRHPVLSNQ